MVCELDVVLDCCRGSDLQNSYECEAFGPAKGAFIYRMVGVEMALMIGSILMVLPSAFGPSYILRCLIDVLAAFLWPCKCGLADTIRSSYLEVSIGQAHAVTL